MDKTSSVLSEPAQIAQPRTTVTTTASIDLDRRFGGESFNRRSTRADEKAPLTCGGSNGEHERAFSRGESQGASRRVAFGGRRSGGRSLEALASRTAASLDPGDVEVVLGRRPRWRGRFRRHCAVRTGRRRPVPGWGGHRVDVLGDALLGDGDWRGRKSLAGIVGEYWTAQELRALRRRGWRSINHSCSTGATLITC